MTRKMKGLHKRTSFHISNELKADIQKIAENEDRSESSVVRSALREYVDKKRKEE